MRLKAPLYYLILVSIFFTLLFSSCQTNNTPTESNNLPDMPAFTDNIPYADLGSGKIAFERIGPQNNTYMGIVIIDIDKKTAKIFSGIMSQPCLAPNGDKIAYIAPSNATLSYDVFVMNVDGTGAENISGTAEDDRFPAWSKDEQKIYYYNSPFYSFGPQNLIVQSPRSAALDVQYLPHDDYAAGPISISDKKIVYYAYYSPSGIYTINLDGSSPISLLSKPKDRYLESPCFSPDGNSIAYLSVVRDSTGLYHSVEVKVMNADGSSPKSVITVNAGGSREWYNADQVNDVSVCWSPDGKKLLFVVQENDFESHIYVVNTNGTGLTKITSIAGVTDRKVSWSK